VVLDNLEYVGAAREWLNRLGGGPVRLLITARRAGWPTDLGLAVLPLDVFTPEESRAFLRRHLPSSSQGEPALSEVEGRPGVRISDADLDALAERLYHLPLALELAGRYLAGHPRLGVVAYVERLETIWDDPSMAGWKAELGNPTDHDLSLAATFAISWQCVTDETARRLFLLASWCAPNEPIPCELFERAAGLESQACDEALSTLTGLGLLEMDDPAAGPTIHPLLAGYARSLASACVLDVEVERALAIDEAVYGPDHPMVARDVNNLGGVLQDLGDLGGARAAFERALTIDEAVYGPDHPNVAIRVNNIGSVLQDLEDLMGARAAYERALRIFGSILPPDHPHIRIVRDNLERLRLST